MFSSDPNQPVQNYEIVNPTLEQQIANLLPSVAGYGGNLRSTNTIIPVVDVTSAAEGTVLPFELQQALAFGSQTAFSITNTTTTIVSNTGFYRIAATSGVFAANGSTVTNSLDITDGVSTKRVFQHTVGGTGGQQGTSVPIDLIVFMGSGESISGTSSATSAFIVGSSRQIATANGTLVDPSGFPI